MNDRELAIHDKAFGLGIKSGWNAAHKVVRKPVVTLMGKQIIDVCEPDERALAHANKLICDANKYFKSQGE